MGGQGTPINAGSPSSASASGSGSRSGPNSDSSVSPGVDPVSGEVGQWLQDILTTTMIANRDRYNLHLSLGVLEAPPPPLRIAMNLVACHILTRSAGPTTRPTAHDLDVLKPLLLSKVYSGIHTSLENARDLLVGAVCAPALAAQYLLEVGRFAEAQWLASNAIRFAVSSGIHTITRHIPTPVNTPDLVQSTSNPSLLSRNPSSSFLLPPRSPQEHRDRLMIWWLAYAADGLVEAVAGLPSALRAEILACLGDMEAYLSGATGIPAVFPLPEAMYESNALGPDVRSINISELLLGGDVPDASAGSVFAGFLKAFSFYHAAVSIDDCIHTGRSLDQNMSSNIYRSISSFVSQMAIHNSGNHVNGNSTTSIRILAHTATIRLYATSMIVEEQHRRTGAASAIAQLSTMLSEEELQAQPQLLERCCSEALQVLRSGGPASEVVGAQEVQTLYSLIEQLRQSGAAFN
ncbi:hypothetical protein RhiJN_14631 [Ceratobasidium sp. AG-Ba]|nr:hypothetical protein RhiJN_14631 [Ceratobasidium sp. AG-Ba]QRW15169.1 hypothetical protein RhiLY_14168 [Ceratobasidium sp. AG-Ba]